MQILYPVPYIPTLTEHLYNLLFTKSSSFFFFLKKKNQIN